MLRTLLPAIALLLLAPSGVRAQAGAIHATATILPPAGVTVEEGAVQLRRRASGAVDVSVPVTTQRPGRVIGVRVEGEEAQASSLRDDLPAASADGLAPWSRWTVRVSLPPRETPDVTPAGRTVVLYLVDS
jgi:hypothetical protein